MKPVFYLRGFMMHGASCPTSHELVVQLFCIDDE